ncbi:MAG: ferrous iron transport protein A [Fervidobacterium sp.]|nr:ferrous iron transport protein A [Fervidobacterium sp.]
MRLSEVPVGTVVEVRKLYKSDILPKLRAVGILPGVKIQIVKAAPMGDPKIYKVFNKLISLRNSEAEVVEVDIIQDQPLPATFVEPGKYVVVNIQAGKMSRYLLSKCGIVEGALIEIKEDKKIVTSVGTFDIGFGRLSKVFVSPAKNEQVIINNCIQFF